MGQPKHHETDNKENARGREESNISAGQANSFPNPSQTLGNQHPNSQVENTMNKALTELAKQSTVKGPQMESKAPK